jgi:endo-1,4-beta-xylanase
VAFGNEHKLPVTGHMLVWNQLTPPWMFEGPDGKPLPRDKALANMKLHIETVVRHYKGKLSSWDVANEAISENPKEYMRDTPALEAIGPDYVQKAFEYAHEADPDVPLYYNDFNVENPVKLPKVLRLIRSLKAAGVRLDAIGIQGHWLLDYPDSSVIEAGIEALGKEGIKVIVTELDVDVLPRDRSDPYKSGIPASMLKQEAKRYVKLFAVFKRHRDLIPRVTFWGVDDSQSWLNDTPTKGRMNYPLLFDRTLQAKPAYQAVVDELSTR